MDDKSRLDNSTSPDDYAPPDLFEVRITGDRETIARLMRTFKLDVGCRPHPQINADGSVTLLAYANEGRIRELQTAGYRVEQGENVSELGRQRQKEVGQGDRFEGGRIAPRGLGQKPGYLRKGGDGA